MQQLPGSFISCSSHETQIDLGPPGEFKHEELINKEESRDILGSVSWKDIYSSCTTNDPPIHTPNFSNSNTLDNNLSSEQVQESEAQPVNSIFSEILKQHRFSDLDPLELLKDYAKGFTKSKGEKVQNKDDKTYKLSTEEIIRMGGERYIECTLQGIDHNLVYMQPYSSSLSSLSLEELRDVDIGHFLLTAAEKVGYQQFEQANPLLAHCERLVSDNGNPIQRLVYYFARALRERIGRETGKIITRRIEEKEKLSLSLMGTSTNLVYLKLHQEIPFNQVTVFTGIQAILERMENKNRIHLIDFEIRSGVQWTTLMQALAERTSNPILSLKITAIAIMDCHKVKETGKSLETFANSLNLRFSFSIIFLSDMQALRNEHFQIKACEALIVYCPIILRTMISRPNCLQHVMKVIKKLNPSMMVVTEVEANLNSPSFFNRFIDSLFFYSAYFDCLEYCTDCDDPYRKILERESFGDGIYNIVAAEGEGRITRSVQMNVWKTFFQRFGIVPLGLSESYLFRANLLMDRFACKSLCSIEKKGNCLTVGWKGTPIQSVSTWKFC